MAFSHPPKHRRKRAGFGPRLLALVAVTGAALLVSRSSMVESLIGREGEAGRIGSSERSGGARVHSAFAPRAGSAAGPQETRFTAAWLNRGLEQPATPSSKRRLELKKTITGQISPKSIVASGTGVFFAQNMMYRHTITVYDRRGKLIRTISDSVNLADFGYDKYNGTYKGAPVEAAFSPDGRYAYVSNYAMYGPGFGGEGSDSCSPASGYDDSFLYRVDVSTLKIDKVIRVGAVPKFVAVTPDDRYVLVANWCSYTLSIVSVETAREVRQIELGPHPRGIAVSPDSTTAYVAVMGSTDVAKVRLADFKVRWIRGVGTGPRHLNIDTEGRYLYATLNSEGTVAKIDLRKEAVVAKATTGRLPRSMAIAADGRSLYVVNNGSDTVNKVRTRDMKVLQTVGTNHHPIGITYDAPSQRVWVACYTGSIMILKDRLPPV